MNYNSLTNEDKEWLLRIEDLKETADRRKAPKFTKFCDERLIYVYENFSSANGFVTSLSWGGYAGFERAVVGFFPDYMEADTSLFPITILNIKGAKGCSHRDFLGSILGLGINRDMIGDILIKEDNCHVFVHSTISDYILYNLKKVANKNVTLEICDDISAIPSKEFEEISGTVSSVRLDCIVSLFTHKSRGDTQSLINSERVFINHTPQTSASYKLNEGDVISVRKFGKAKLTKICGETKKGRIRIILNKYV